MSDRPASKFQYRGHLRETALPEMLYSIERFRVAGVIEASSGPVEKRVFLRDGYVIHAASNDRSDSLGEFLRRRGDIDSVRLDEVSKERARSKKKRVGELLIECGLMTPGEVFNAIREQIEDVVWSLFYWQDGEVTFSIGEFRDADMIQIQLPVGRVIIEGIKRAPEAKPLVERVGKKDTVLEPTFQPESLIELGLDADEYALLRAVDGVKTLYELCSDGPFSAAENAKLLYAFRVLHLITGPSPMRTQAGRVKIQLRSQGDQFSV